jgi:hypothetical protein
MWGLTPLAGVLLSSSDCAPSSLGIFPTLEARRDESCKAEVVGLLLIDDRALDGVDGAWEEATRVVPASRCQHLKLVLT